jgi:hypothetical protein
MVEFDGEEKKETINDEQFVNPYDNIKVYTMFPGLFLHECCHFIIAFIVGGKPVMNFVRDKHGFGAHVKWNNYVDKYMYWRIIAVSIAPAILYLSLLVIAILNLNGKYWMLWTVILCYLCYAFQAMWLSASDYKDIVFALKGYYEEDNEDINNDTSES